MLKFHRQLCRSKKQQWFTRFVRSCRTELYLSIQLLRNNKMVGRKRLYTDDQEQTFIELVQDRPFLYDTRHPNYRDTTQKQNAWIKISELMKIETLAGDKCMGLWDGLRNQFTHYKAKLNQPSGSGRKTPYFRHARAMEFLSEHRLTSSSEESQIFSNLTFETDDFEDGTGVVPNGVDDDNSENIAPDQVTSAPKPSSLPLSRSHAKKSKLDPFQKEILDALREPDQISPQDEYDLFCASLAPKLRRLGEKCKYDASKLQYDVLGLFVNAELLDLESN